MCGRYATTRTSADLSVLFEAFDATASGAGSGGVTADYNVAPTDPVPVVRMSASARGRVLDVARWGLLPPWAPDRRGAARMINARVETVATARAYAKPFATRRCLVPADGWYEFAVRPHSTVKQPYFMTPRNGDLLAFAGLWSIWGKGDDRILTCSIVTTDAIGDLVSVHDRMPLFLAPERWEAWLTATTDLERLLAPPTLAQAEALEIRPVGPAVRDVRSDGPDLVRRVADPDGAATDLTLF